MSASWEWPGSRWWRVDLHAHSPASYDFKPIADRDAKDWARWVDAAERARLDAVALTDHNVAQGIAAIQQAAKAVSGAPVLFPGVELTASDGTHLLVILDPGCTLQHVEELLAHAKIPVDQRGQPAARSPLSVEQILKLECERGVIFLGAHVNGPDGLLEHDGRQRIAELRHPGLSGVEIDPSRALDTSWLDGSRAEIARTISQVWGSDSHAFDEAGRRFTWVKMTRPDAEGLRLALMDGSGSLQTAMQEDPGDPNKHAADVIESIEIRQAKYMGRSTESERPGPLTVPFNPWLNVIIGGRGTGKSTLVDLVRKTLRRDGELKGGDEGSLRTAFDKRMSVPGKRDEEGLLTFDTEVAVTYRKDGERFRLAWDQRGSARPISRVVDDQLIPEEGDIRERFPVRIYSQKQLFDLAKEPNALLTVIDDSADVRGSEFARLLAESETKFLSLCAEARALRTQAAELPARAAALVDVRRKLELLQQEGHAQTLNDFRARRRQDGTWESIQKTAVDSVETVRRAADGLEVADLDVGPEALGDSATAVLGRVHEKMRGIVARLQKSVLNEVERARTQIEALRAGDDAKAWREVVASTELSYQTVTKQLADAGIANPDEYRDLLQRATTLEQEIAALEKRRVAGAEREKEATAELFRYRNSRSELTARRQVFASKTSNELVRVKVRGFAMREELEGFLRDALSIDRFDDAYRALIARAEPEAGEPWDFGKLDKLVAELREILADPGKQWTGPDRRFETALRRLQPERLDRVALCLPGDAVDVDFRAPTHTKAEWQHLAQGSPGQQTAALLAFVLGYGEEPIILDQPEDDLDNTLIYDLVVRRLRATKPRRQVIVVTHNPNIVVHGDAEYVVSLEASGGQTRIRFAGGLQEQAAREEICRVMEGGRDAFETRYRRIMHPGGR